MAQMRFSYLLVRGHKYITEFYNPEELTALIADYKARNEKMNLVQRFDEDNEIINRSSFNGKRAINEYISIAPEDITEFGTYVIDPNKEQLRYGNYCEISRINNDPVYYL